MKRINVETVLFVTANQAKGSITCFTDIFALSKEKGSIPLSSFLGATTRLTLSGGLLPMDDVELLYQISSESLDNY